MFNIRRCIKIKMNAADLHIIYMVQVLKEKIVFALHALGKDEGEKV